MSGLPLQALLFDLDGTLIDSAPDLGGAGNDLRARHGLAPLPLADYRPMTGAGARGLLGVAFGIGPEHADFEALKTEFLALYEARMTRETRVFAAMEPVLAALEARGLPWGIVTNKASRFAAPLVQALGLAQRSAVLICGDSAARAKPWPDPLLLAAERLGVAPARCAYVGDDLRDIQAARAAGMLSVAAGWGYLGAGEPIERWNADRRADLPQQLLPALDLA
ncbi:MAG: hypothetical protein RJA44_2200 [Pseudomonadota bacterium]